MQSLLDACTLPAGWRSADDLAYNRCALQCIAAKIRHALPIVQVREEKVAPENLLIKLTVRALGGAKMKIEPNTVPGGALDPTTERNLTSKVVEVFGRSATMRVFWIRFGC